MNQRDATGGTARQMNGAPNGNVRNNDASLIEPIAAA
jgi:hypothetical protein